MATKEKYFSKARLDSFCGKGNSSFVAGKVSVLYATFATATLSIFYEM
jgi:hypothetical protein